MSKKICKQCGKEVSLLVKGGICKRCRQHYISTDVYGKLRNPNMQFNEGWSIEECAEVFKIHCSTGFRNNAEIENYQKVEARYNSLSKYKLPALKLRISNGRDH